jgi:hypothetical protein
MDFLRAVLRCLSFRRFDPYDAPIGTIPVVLGFFALVATDLPAQYLISQANWSFSEYGLVVLIASNALYVLAALAFFAGPNSLPMTAVTAWGLTVIQIALSIVLYLFLKIVGWTGSNGSSIAYLGFIAITQLPIIWLLLVPVIVVRSYDPFHWRRPVLVTLGLFAVSAATPFVIHFEPVFYSEAYANAAPRTIWARLEDLLSSDDKAEDVDPEAAQAEEETWYRSEWELASVTTRSLAQIAPADADKPTLFSISVGGMPQAVFDRESGSAAGILDRLFHVGPHAIRLVNGEETFNTPAATLETLSRAIDAVGTRMNSERDALVLFITSHGSSIGVSLSGPHAHQSLIRPLDLRFALDRAGIKNRIIIVSACHSGIFVPLFSDDRSAVFTAASAENVSFGCNDTNSWTYFGSAFFQHGLDEKHNLIGAFVRARDLVWGWEAKSQTHSDPQAHVGKTIAAQFPDIIGDLAELKPFDPAQAANDQTIAPAPASMAE